MNAECTSAHSHGEFGVVVVDDRGRDPLLDSTKATAAPNGTQSS